MLGGGGTTCGRGPFGDVGEGGGDAIVDEMQFFGGDAVGRQDVNYVAERAEQNSGVKEKIVELGAKRRKISRVLGAELDGSDGSDTADVADGGMIFNGGEALLMNLGDPGDALEDRLVFKNAEACNCRSSSDGIPGIGMSVVKSAAAIFADEGTMNFFRANCGGER